MIGKSSIRLLAIAGLLVGGATAFAAPIDLGAAAKTFTVSNPWVSNVGTVSFDYTAASTGSGLNFYTGGATWVMPITFNTAQDSLPAANLLHFDSDYGPYDNQALDLSVSHHYVLTINRYKGEVNVSIDGSPVSFQTVAGNTNDPQPDGSAVTGGVAVTNLFYSDETPTAIANAASLGWTANAGGPGVGGVHTLMFQFGQATGASVDNFAAVVPEPSSVALGLLGIVGLFMIRRRKNVPVS